MGTEAGVFNPLALFRRSPRRQSEAARPGPSGPRSAAGAGAPKSSATGFFGLFRRKPATPHKAVAPRQSTTQPRSTPATPSSLREPFLATHGVEKSFGGRKVVRGASLYVRRGEA